MQVGALNRKSRPPQSLADPLGELMKQFNGLIEEFGKFCGYVSALVHGSATYQSVLFLPELTTKPRRPGPVLVRN